MKLFKSIFFLLLTALLLISCSDDTLPKPKAFLRLSYENANYTTTHSNCPYSFEISTNATATFNDKCWVNVKYPALKATINITYRNVDSDINELLRESEKLTYNHAIKADGISSKPYINNKDRKFGSLSEVTGNAASPIQFHLTDSTRHFLTGALYFEVQPNYDSILPAIKYVQKDIIHLMETLQWKSNNQ